MIAMAMGGANLWVIVGATAFMNLGSPLAGEALYKVWTQESFPIEIRAPCRLYQRLLSSVLWPVRTDHPGPGAA